MAKRKTKAKSPKSGRKKSSQFFHPKHAQNKSIVKSAYIALGLAWAFALLPVPGVSYLGLAICNITAIILGVVSLVKDEIKTGIIVLVGALVGSPIMYLIGWFLIGSMVAGSSFNLFKLFK